MVQRNKKMKCFRLSGVNMERLKLISKNLGLNNETEVIEDLIEFGYYLTTATEENKVVVSDMFVNKWSDYFEF